MDFKNSFSISAIGMTYERARVDVSAMNLANANAPLKADGSGYRPMRVVPTTSQNPFTFAGLINGDFSPVSQLQRFTVEPAETLAPRQVYEPGHPLASSRGFVSYPAVDVATETVSMMTAMRAYEANVAAMNVSRNMALKALEIGGGN